MTTIIRQALFSTENVLINNGFEEGRLEAELLLCHMLRISKTELHIRLDEKLSNKQSNELDSLIQRRVEHEPVAHIVGHKEFFGLDFSVTPDTLIPRPETELLVEKTLEIAGEWTLQGGLIADIGTGCGAIAVALAVNLPTVEVYGIDISSDALEVAASNSKKHNVSNRINLFKGDLLEPLPCAVDIMLANLPYISDGAMSGLSDDIRMFEPKVALAGGPDGMYEIKRLLIQAGEKLRTGGSLLLEMGPEQIATVTNLASKYFPEATVEVMRDLNGCERVICIKKDIRKV